MLASSLCIEPLVTMSRYMLSSIFIIDRDINIQEIRGLQAASMYLTTGCSFQLLYRFLLSEKGIQEKDSVSMTHSCYLRQHSQFFDFCLNVCSYFLKMDALTSYTHNLM